MRTVEISENAWEILQTLIKQADLDPRIPRVFSEGDTVEIALILFKNMNAYPHLRDAPIAWGLLCMSVNEFELAYQQRKQEGK